MPDKYRGDVTHEDMLDVARRKKAMEERINRIAANLSKSDSSDIRKFEKDYEQFEDYYVEVTELVDKLRRNVENIEGRFGTRFYEISLDELDRYDEDDQAAIIEEWLDEIKQFHRLVEGHLNDMKGLPKIK